VINKAYVLDDGIKCKVTKSAKGAMITLPSRFTVNTEFKVIVLEFAGEFSVSPSNILKLEKQHVSLGHDNSFKYYSNSGIDYATRYTSTIKETWTLQSSADASVSPELFYSEEEKGTSIDLTFNGTTQTIALSDGDKIPLENNLPSERYGPLYLQGPFWSEIEGAHGIINEIDVSQLWPESNCKSWQAMPDWENGNLHTLSADRESAYYVLQEIESNEDKKVIVKITSGDALTVWMNGKQRYIQINPLKRDTLVHFISLDLKRGKNQLLVKLFNNFQKQIHFAIDFSVPQIIYRKELPPFKVKKNKMYSIDWKLHHPTTPHQGMNVPNLQIVLRPKGH
jgi:alpha-L-fucosidase